MNNFLLRIAAATAMSLFIYTTSIAQNCEGLSLDELLTTDQQTITIEDVTLMSSTDSGADALEVLGDVTIEMTLSSFQLSFNSKPSVVVGERNLGAIPVSGTAPTVNGYSLNSSFIRNGGGISMQLRTPLTRYIYEASRDVNGFDRKLNLVISGTAMNSNDIDFSDYVLSEANCGLASSIEGNQDNVINATYQAWQELSQ